MQYCGKKWFGLLLAVLMLVSLLPVAALAADGDVTEPVAEEVEEVVEKAEEDVDNKPDEDVEDEEALNENDDENDDENNDENNVEDAEEVVEEENDDENVAPQSEDIYLGGTVNDSDVAKIGDTGYDTLAEAFEAATTGSTIELLKDVTLTAGIVTDVDGLTINGNGHTISATLGQGQNPMTNVLRFNNPGALKINNLTVDATAGSGIRIVGNTVAELTNVTITGTYDGALGLYLNNNEGAKLTGCSLVSVFANADSDRPLTLKDTTIGTLYVNDTDGTFTTPKVVLADGDSGTKVDNLICNDADTRRVSAGVMGVVEQSVACNTNWTGTANSEGVTTTPVASVNGVQYATLAGAIEAANAAEGSTTVTVLKDCDILQQTEITSAVVLDLNGHTVTAKNSDGDPSSIAADVKANGDLTVKDSSEAGTGVLKSGNGSGGANTVYVEGGKFTLESGKIESENNAITTQSTAGSTIIINGGTIECNVNTKESAVMYLNNQCSVTINGGTMSGFHGIRVLSNLTIIINDGELTAKGALTSDNRVGVAIFGQGEYGVSAEVTINGGKITSEHEAAIYNPGKDSKLTVTGGEITGTTAIYMKGGSLSITGGTFKGTGEQVTYSPQSGGFESTGDAVIIENYGNGYGTPAVSITGGTFISENAQAIASEANTDDNMEAITGFISGGVFASQPGDSLLKNGYTPVTLTDGSYGVVEKKEDGTLDIDYETVKINVWSRESSGWDEQTQEQTNIGVFDIPGIRLGVYDEDGKQVTTVTTSTVDTGDKDYPYYATLSAKDLNMSPDDPDATYTVKQVTAQKTEHGDRPIPQEAWELTAAREVVDGKITMTLTFEDTAEMGRYYGNRNDETGFFEIYNDCWTNAAFVLEKTVSVKNKGAQPGANSFDFMVVYGCYEDYEKDGVCVPTLGFTAEGGKTVYPTVRLLDDGSSACTVSLAVDGAGTARGLVTFEGWERDLEALNYTEVYELGDDSDSWDQADCMYYVTFPVYGRSEDDFYILFYTGVQMEAFVVAQLDKAPAGGEDAPNGGNYENGYRGYDGKWYEIVFGAADKVSFVNTYLGAAAPAATTKPAQSPKTGDEANVVLWIVLASVSMMGAAVLARKKVK